MEDLDFFTNLVLDNNSTQNDYLSVLFDFILCVAMSFLLRSFYIKKSFSLTGKMHIGSIIPILATVVFLVILVVKSSLALSLGLVGALSIVRFRTPIKEPEELVYLFLAIAIGLGYAAGQTVLTTIIFIAILTINFFWLSNQNISKSIEYNMVITWSEKNLSFKKITKTVSITSDSLKLIRLEYGKDFNTAVLQVFPKESLNIDHLSKELKALDQDLTISFFEAKANW